MRRSVIPLAFTLSASLLACSGSAGNSDLFGGPSAPDQVVGDRGKDGPDDPPGSKDGEPGHVPNGDAGSKTADASAADATLPDAGHEDAGHDPGIYCGTDNTGTPVECVPGQEVCCATGVSSGSPGYACGSAGQCAMDGVPIACDDDADCSGRVCCAHHSDVVGYRSITCESTCDGADANGDTLVRLCDPSRAVTECDSLGLKCVESQALPGFHVCN